jgi:hypothetical protein
MPIERREVRLDNTELMQAVASYAHQTPGVLPTGSLVGVQVRNHDPGAPSVTAAVRLAAEPQALPIEVRLSHDSVLELMVRFCKEEGIPVPRAGAKAVTVIAGLLTLVIDQSKD